MEGDSVVAVPPVQGPRLVPARRPHLWSIVYIPGSVTERPRSHCCPKGYVSSLGASQIMSNGVTLIQSRQPSTQKRKRIWKGCELEPKSPRFLSGPQDTGGREPEILVAGCSRTCSLQDRGGVSLALPPIQSCHWLREEAVSQSPQILIASGGSTSASGSGPAPALPASLAS